MLKWCQKRQRKPKKEKKLCYLTWGQFKAKKSYRKSKISIWMEFPFLLVFFFLSSIFWLPFEMKKKSKVDSFAISLEKYFPTTQEYSLRMIKRCSVEERMNEKFKYCKSGTFYSADDFIHSSLLPKSNKECIKIKKTSNWKQIKTSSYVKLYKSM